MMKVKDIESNTKTDSEMETEADSEGQSGVPQKTNLVLARYAETDSKANDDSDSETLSQELKC